MRNTIFITALLHASFAFSMNTGTYHEIDKLYTWADYADNVFKVVLVNQSSSANVLCPAGYWLDKSSTINSSVYSVALSAYHSKTKVMVYADENNEWPGVSAKDCKIQLIVTE